MKNESNEDKVRHADNVLIAFRFKRLLPRLDEAVSRGDLCAIQEIRDQMKLALKPLPVQLGGATLMPRKEIAS